MNTSDERVRVARELNESAQNMREILIDELWDEPLEEKMFAIDQAVGWKLGYPDNYALTQLAKLIDPTCKPVITVESLTESLTKYTSECSECGAIFGDFPTREQAETTHPTYCPCCGSRVITPNSGKDDDSEC